ncbi:M20/M25/M40 family metallo-hydrolase [Chlamydiota bacterium]
MNINKERLIATFLELVKISSPSKDERKIADYVKQLFNRSSFIITEDDCGDKIGGNCGNLIGEVKGTVPESLPLIFVVHLDTVGPCEGTVPLRENGVIRSDGSTILGADDKAGIASVIELLYIREETGFMKWSDIIIIFTVAEEIGLLGSKHLDLTRYSHAPVYVLDSVCPVGYITNQAPYGERIKIEVIGKAAHAGVCPEKGINAFKMCVNALYNIRLGRIDSYTTTNIGTIHGGTAINIVPEQVVLEGEIRSQDESLLIHERKKLIALFAKEASLLGGEVHVKTERDYNGFCIPKDHLLISLAQRAAKKIEKKVTVQKSGGGSDANIFNDKGLEAVVLGVGYENAHSTQEQITEENLILHCKWIYEIARLNTDRN